MEKEAKVDQFGAKAHEKGTHRSKPRKKCAKGVKSEFVV